MAEHVAFEVEATYRRVDGAWRVLRTKAEPRFDGDGVFLGMIGANADVTEARKAEGDLLRINELLEERVAEALAVPIDELVASPRAKVRLYRSDEVDKRKLGRGITMRPLVPEPTPSEQLSLMELAPGGVMGGTPHLPGTREFFTCLTGSVVIIVAGERHALSPGDVLAFPGNVAHSYQNGGPSPARGVSVVVLSRTGV